jgi:hypothetical protein
MSTGKLIQTAVERDDDALGLGRARGSFLAALQGAFTGMITRLEDALFDLAQSNQSEFERGVSFDAIRELRLGREAIDARFADRLLGCWQALERGEGPLARQLGGNDLDEALALTAAVRRAETECADALRTIRSSLALIVGVPDGDEALGPRQVFAALEEAFRDTLTEPSVRRILLTFFERHVGAALPGLYRDLAAALDRPPEATKPSQLPQVADLPALDVLVNEAGQRGDLDLSALIQQALAGGGNPSGSEATKLLATLQQHDKPGSRSRSASIDLARFATRPADGGVGDPSQQIVLDMVALLFDGVFSDSAVPVSARLAIARLQIPFLRLALRDRAVLARRSHLGRRFFDQLIAVTRGWQEPPTPQQRQVLEALIDSVGEACMDDHRAFAVAAETGLLDLRTLALPAADSAQSLQAQRRSLTARVEAELAERRQQVGRLPDPVDAFLGTHWMQYLVNCLDSHGPEASPFRQALATADALLWSVSPKEGAAQQRLAELRPRMTRRLRQGMDQVGVSMFEQEAFLETLETILDRAQAGQPVWDWDQESAIDELLGVDEPLAVPSGAVSVVELDKPAPPVRLVAQQPARPASPPPVSKRVATWGSSHCSSGSKWISHCQPVASCPTSCGWIWRVRTASCRSTLRCRGCASTCRRRSAKRPAYAVTLRCACLCRGLSDATVGSTGRSRHWRSLHRRMPGHKGAASCGWGPARPICRPAPGYTYEAAWLNSIGRPGRQCSISTARVTHSRRRAPCCARCRAISAVSMASAPISTISALTFSG